MVNPNLSAEDQVRLWSEQGNMSLQAIVALCEPMGYDRDALIEGWISISQDPAWAVRTSKTVMTVRTGEEIDLDEPLLYPIRK